MKSIETKSWSLLAKKKSKHLTKVLLFNNVDMLKEAYKARCWADFYNWKLIKLGGFKG